MSISVRPIREGDRNDWRALWTAYLEFYGTTVTDEVFETTFSRIVDNDPFEFNGFLAEVDGSSVGLAHYLFHRHCWRVENVCYLQDLYARPDMRGQGVGRALIEAVYDAADRADAPAVYWLTQIENRAARTLYDRIGRETSIIKYERPL